MLVLRKLTQLSLKDVDPTPILNGISAIQRSQEQIDRSVRDEISRNRQENAQQLQGLRSEVLTTLTGMGDSVAIKVEALNRSTEQKLELLRSGMEQRLDLFTAESSRKIDALTQSVTTASVRLQDEVSAKLTGVQISWKPVGVELKAKDLRC